MAFNLGSAIFGGEGAPPTYQPPALTTGTEQAVGQVNANANESPETIQRELMNGVAGAGQGLLASSSSLGQQESALGMGSSEAQRQALVDRGQRIYGQGIESMQSQTPMAAHQMQMSRLKQAQDVLQARDKYYLNVAGSQLQNLLDQNASRMGVLGEVIGGVSSGAGYIGGMMSAKKKAGQISASEVGSGDVGGTSYAGSSDMGSMA
jgi:hypothetical protein